VNKQEALEHIIKSHEEESPDIIDGGKGTVEIQTRKIQSIAIPPLGSGLGGLSWNDVRQRIIQTLKGLDDVKIIIYEPKGAPVANKMVKAKTPLREG